MIHRREASAHGEQPGTVNCLWLRQGPHSHPSRFCDLLFGAAGEGLYQEEEKRLVCQHVFIFNFCAGHRNQTFVEHFAEFLLWSPLMLTVTLGSRVCALILLTGAQSGQVVVQGHTPTKRQS